MDFKEAKEFIETIYAEIEGGIPYQPDTETETAIKEIFKMASKQMLGTVIVLTDGVTL